MFLPSINPSDYRLQIFLCQAQESWHGQKIWSKFSRNISSPNLVLRQARNPPPLQNFRATCHKIKANVVTWSAVWRVAAVSTARSSQELRPTGGFGMGSAAPIRSMTGRPLQTCGCSINWWIKGPSWLLRPDWCSFCFTARFPPLSFKHHILDPHLNSPILSLSTSNRADRSTKDSVSKPLWGKFEIPPKWP